MTGSIVPKHVEFPPGAHDADIAFLRDKIGWLTADLDEGELAAFDRLCDAGLAHRSYTGVAGFLGLSRVAIP